MKKLCLLLAVLACGLTASRPRLAGQASSAAFPLEEATVAQLQDWMAARTQRDRLPSCTSSALRKSTGGVRPCDL
jgi:hypothetical protein